MAGVGGGDDFTNLDDSVPRPELVTFHHPDDDEGKPKKKLSPVKENRERPKSGARTAAKSNIIDMADTTLRAEKLRSLAGKEIFVDIMRALFRLLDEDGSGELSPDEFRTGMVLLDFPEVADPVVLSRLITAIDEDRTGTITEPEFLSFFADKSRDVMVDLLESFRCDKTSINALVYDARDMESANTTIEHWNVSAVRQKLEEAHEKNKMVWIDILGYDPAVIKILARQFRVSEEDLTDSMVMQEPAIAALKSNPTVIQIPCYCVEFSSSPLNTAGKELPQPLRSCKHVLCGGSSRARVPAYVRNKALVSNKAALGISLSLEPISILLLNDRTVLTIRVPQFNEEDPNHNPFRDSATTLGLSSDLRQHASCESMSFSFWFFIVLQGIPSKNTWSLSKKILHLLQDAWVPKTSNHLWFPFLTSFFRM